MWWMKNLRWSTTSGTSYATPKDREKSLTQVGIEPTTSRLDHRCSTDWATRPDGSRPWEFEDKSARPKPSTKCKCVLSLVACICIQLFRESLSRIKCTRQSRKVIWDMINTLFLTTVAVEPTFVTFLQHSQTYISVASRTILLNFFEK